MVRFSKKGCLLVYQRCIFIITIVILWWANVLSVNHQRNTCRFTTSTMLLRNDLPVVRNDAPVVRNDAPMVRNDAPMVRNVNRAIERGARVGGVPVLSTETVEMARIFQCAITVGSLNEKVTKLHND